MKVLVVNAGSSSLKYQLFNTETNEDLAKGLCDRIGIEGSTFEQQLPSGVSVKKDVPEMVNHTVATEIVLSYLTEKEYGCISDMSEIEAVGHRIVHGGTYFTESVLVNDDVLAKLRNCVDLAPLHTPPHIMGIEG